MKGKKKCKILKEIRKQIAKQNDIAYITSECKHQGDCRGTCPKCEAEVRYLEEELKKRSLAGKKVAVAGVAAAMVVSSSGCGLEDLFNVGQTAGDMMPESQTEVSLQGGNIVSQNESSEIETAGVPVEEFTATDGEMVPEESEWETMGEEPLPEGSSDEECSFDEIMGDYEVIPSEDEESEKEFDGIPYPDDSSEEESEVELGGEPMPDDYIGE